MSLAFWGQVIGCALSLALGVLFVHILLGASAGVGRAFLCFTGCGVGFGLSSMIWFVVWCRGGSGSPLVPLAAEFLVLLLLLKVSRRSVSGPGSSPLSFPAVPAWALVISAAATLCAVVYFLRFLRQSPYGGWDAFSIWNLHARAFFLGGGRIWKTHLFKIPWSHPDYPLSIPLNVARLWFLAGYEATTAPASIAFLFTASVCGVLTSGLSAAKNWFAATLALVTLLASTKFLWYGFQEYADIPQSFYLLSALVAYTLFEKNGNLRFLMLAGLSCGLAVWTKNEGWLFLACFVAAQLVVVFATRSLRGIGGRAVALLSGILLPLIVTLVYKCKNPARSDVVGWSTTVKGLVQAFEPARLTTIFASFGRILWDLDTWFVSSVAILAVYFLLAGFERNKTMRRAGAVSMLTIVFMLTGYVFVYATSPRELLTYLRDSLDRLYIQLWPSSLFTLFLSTRTPFAGLLRLESISEQTRADELGAKLYAAK